jgi:hypothetical protein
MNRTIMANFKKPDVPTASPGKRENLKFERKDWSLFRTVEGLQQKAGVSKGMLRRLVLKELADNALDESGRVDIDERDDLYAIEDRGRGIDGTPEDIARLFSIARPLVSTKLFRLPTRGALGNGLRVVASAVLVSNGTLTVITRNRRIELRPERDGTTAVVRVKKADFPTGTGSKSASVRPCPPMTTPSSGPTPLPVWPGTARLIPANLRRGGTISANSASCFTLPVTGRYAN